MTKKQQTQRRKNAQAPKPRPKTKKAPRLLNGCAAKYAVAMADPFSPAAKGACVALSASTPTFKYTKKVLVPISIESGSNPVTILIHPSAVSDQPDVSIYDVPLSTTLNAYPAALATVTGNGAPFTASQYATTGALEQRAVQWGVKVSNTSNKLAAQGSISGYTVAYGDTLTGGRNAQVIRGYAGARLVKHSDELYIRGFTSDAATACSWHDTYQMAGLQGQYTAYAPYSVAVIVFDPISQIEGPNTFTFNLELVTHWECRGRLAVPMASLEPNNTVQAESMLNGILTVMRTTASNVFSKDLLAVAAHSVGTSVNTLLSSAMGRLAQQAGPALIGMA